MIISVSVNIGVVAVIRREEKENTASTESRVGVIYKHTFDIESESSF